MAALAQQLRFSRGSGRLTIACSWAREAPNCFLFRKTAELRGGRLVGAAGIEPATLGLEIRCSIRLSYAPLELLVFHEPAFSLIFHLVSSWPWITSTRCTHT